MDPQKLEKLRIRSEAKRRPTATLFLIFLSVALIIAVAAYFAWPKRGDERRIFGKRPTPSNPSSQIASANIPSAPTNDSVLTVSGYIVNRERIEISPRFLGQVKWIGVKKGDVVTNGQVVVLLDDSEQQAKISEADSRLASSKVAVTKAQLDFDRSVELIADNIESKERADEVRLRLETTKASLLEAEAQMLLAKTYRDWTVIRSPITGVVMEKLVDAGELVTPQSFGGTRGPSTAVLAVADPKDLQVEIELSEADLAKVFLDQQCRVSPEAWPEKQYVGYVAEMAPEANRQKGTLQIKVQVSDPDQYLKPELSAKVDFLKTGKDHGAAK